MTIPNDLRYTTDHEWVRVDNGIATCGITAFAVEQLEEVIYVSFTNDDDHIDADDTIAEVESTKAVSEVFAPLSGEIVDRNADLEEDAEIINSDPYGEGWLFKIALSDEEQLEPLMSAAAYGLHIAADDDDL
jgi:glycine cleavage system H protein